MRIERDLVGGLNINGVVRRGDGTATLIRQPYENPRLVRMIEKEYEAVGFYDLGCHLRRRTPEEQAIFARSAAQIGLRVLPPIESLAGELFCYPFLEDVLPLDQSLPNSGREAQVIIEALFSDLWKAHQHRVVYGDRWSPNILMSSKLGPIHVDFDLAISGPYAVDFEVAQMTYYTAIATPSETLERITQELSVPGWFHQKIFSNVIRRHAQYFKGSLFGDHRHVIEELIDQISARLAIVSAL